MVLWKGLDELFWMWWNVSGLVVAVAVTSIASRFMAPPDPSKLEGTTLTFSGIIAHERKWLAPYAVLGVYFVAILLIAIFSGSILKSFL